jgi:LuxR family transcriptional regulator, quorum-sensing system regulator BjaR1
MTPSGDERWRQIEFAFICRKITGFLNSKLTLWHKRSLIARVIVGNDNCSLPPRIILWSWSICLTAAVHSADRVSELVQSIRSVARSLHIDYVAAFGFPMPGRPLDGNLLYTEVLKTVEGAVAALQAQDALVAMPLSENRPFILDGTLGSNGLTEVGQSPVLAGLYAPGSPYRGLFVPYRDILPFHGCLVFVGQSMVAESDLLELEVFSRAVFKRALKLNALSIERPGCLSPRERRVLELTAVGKTAFDIAEDLEISQRTVHAHLQNAGQKLAAQNKTHTVVEALRHNQIRI